MTFPQYRELLVHINQQHGAMRHVEPPLRKVKYMECITDMRTGTVFHVTIRGFGWQKVLYIMNEHIDNPLSLLERCHRFLDGEGEPDPEEDTQNKSAIAALVRLLTGEFGMQCAGLAEEFGGRDLKFTIPVDVLRKAIKETEDEARGNTNTGRDDGKNNDAGKSG